MRKLEDKQINQKGRQDASGLGQRNEKGDTIVQWATSKNFKIMNTQLQKKAGRDGQGEALMETPKTKLTTS